MKRNPLKKKVLAVRRIVSAIHANSTILIMTGDYAIGRIFSLGEKNVEV